MAKGRRLGILIAAIVLLEPSAALAAPGNVPRVLDVGVGATALILAGLMLLDVLALRRVASGAAIAEHITQVMAAVACLAASVLTRWFARFSPDLASQSHALLGSDLLVIAAMAFFGLYFFNVRRAMMRFLAMVPADEAFAKAQIAEDSSSAEDERLAPKAGALHG